MGAKDPATPQLTLHSGNEAPGQGVITAIAGLARRTLDT